jgi:hypothetical protein
VVILKSLPQEVPAEEIAHTAGPGGGRAGRVRGGHRQRPGQHRPGVHRRPDYPAARLLGAADANMYKVKQATRNAETYVPRQASPTLRAVK